MEGGSMEYGALEGAHGGSADAALNEATDPALQVGGWGGGGRWGVVSDCGGRVGG